MKAKLVRESLSEQQGNLFSQKEQGTLFTKENVLDKIENLNADVVVNKGDILLVAIHDVKAAKELGSRTWNIGEERFFKMYQLDKYKKSYFLFDFSKKSGENEFAFIVGADGDIDSGYRFKGGNPADKKNWEKI